MEAYFRKVNSWLVPHMIVNDDEELLFETFEDVGDHEWYFHNPLVVLPSFA